VIKTASHSKGVNSVKSIAKNGFSPRTSQLLSRLNIENLVTKDLDLSKEDHYDEEEMFLNILESNSPTNFQSNRQRHPVLNSNDFSQNEHSLNGKRLTDSKLKIDKNVTKPSENNNCEVGDNHTYTSQHYGALDLNLRVGDDQDVQFTGYGSVVITKKTPNKSPTNFVEPQRLSHF
jgi:hypothetical protein